MRRLVHRIAVAAATLAVAVGVAAPAASAAGASGEISQIHVKNGHVQLLFSGKDLPVGVGLSPSSVRVTIDGRDVATSVKSAAESPVTRSAMLVVDRSGSMAGAGIDGAKRAARTFLASVPDDVRVGLVSFADRAVVDVRPTTDRKAVLTAVDAMQASGSTALYDGIKAAVAAMGSGGVRRVVVLSDGADTKSATRLAALLKGLDGNGVAVDAVALRTTSSERSVLDDITSATGGNTYAATDADGLKVAFASAAKAFVTQLFIDVKLPAGAGGRVVSLAVTAQTPDGALRDGSLVRLPAIAGPAHRSTGAPVDGGTPATQRPLALGIGLGALFLAFAVLAGIGIDARFGRGRRKPHEVIRRYTTDARSPGAPPPTAEEKQHTTARAALQVSEKVLQTRGWGERLTFRLDRAGIAIRANEWLVLQVVGGVVLMTLLVLFGVNLFVAIVLAALVAILVPKIVLDTRAERRRNAFLGELPDALNILAGSLATGYSLDQAIDALIADSREPVKSVFARAVTESRLGVPLERTLQEAAERLELEEFDWAVMAIQVQREVGGSLAEVLRTVATTIRDRARLKRQVRVLSAEGRISAVILVALPLFMALFFLTFKRDYLRPLYTSHGGVVAIVLGVVMIFVGWLWMRKLVKVDA